ncbi:unnamed protein product [Phytomonas sp. EM1]|nr:unnamed protein product [Phytomonas sp. EM1]|eukprot:CCW60852.1 unnamed protein product [Phytomonas sp. isolate EM1]
MTEYKKLAMLVEKLKNDTDALMQGLMRHSLQNEDPLMSGSPTIEELHSIAMDIKHIILQATPRLKKIVSKARETDPDRQIYNEMMCKKIEQLLETFCDVLVSRLIRQENAGDSASKISETSEEMLQNLTDASLEDYPALAKVEVLYDKHMLRRAAAEAWSQRIATDLSGLMKFEEEGRAVLIAREKLTRAKFLEEKGNQKDCILKLLKQKEVEKWESEVARRVLEHAGLHNLSKDLKKHSIPPLISEMISDPALQKLFAARMYRLTKDLLVTPEDERIRYLRNNNQNLIEDFGHPCLSHRLCGCTCRVFNTVAERIWYALGYEVQYSANKSFIPSILVEKGILHDTTLPCGRALHEHQYIVMGFEDYSERFFELKEPDATKKPDEWVLWYEHVREIADTLCSLV